MHVGIDLSAPCSPNQPHQSVVTSLLLVIEMPGKDRALSAMSGRTPWFDAWQGLDMRDTSDYTLTLLQVDSVDLLSTIQVAYNKSIIMIILETRHLLEP